ncbi:MAG TPA: NAD(P)H-dependent oxidoreductase [Candidatus Hydrogenedentes bacterium]|nr:NAD(P)H-dependent oxidoreductase [Candidatus Hydrogenedentota bacterium]HPG70044.1 NAD(P)H-dependent oxidoreductase [Candidatus Hydrogenedentota bacterium]
MKVTILNGARTAEDGLDGVQAEVVGLVERAGHQVTSFLLREIDIAYCLGCFGCWVRTPGVCVIDDGAQAIARAVVQSDVMISLTPITFGGYSSELKKALDRIIGLVSPFFQTVGGETHHKKRYDRYPSTVGIGWLEHADTHAEDLFRALAIRNGINMWSPITEVAILYKDENVETQREVIAKALQPVGIRS